MTPISGLPRDVDEMRQLVTQLESLRRQLEEAIADFEDAKLSTELERARLRAMNVFSIHPRAVRSVMTLETDRHIEEPPRRKQRR